MQAPWKEFKNMIRKSNFKLNWKYALGELVLIFLGISLAIAFQNWNESRKVNNQKALILQQIRTELLQDKTNLEEVIQAHIELDTAVARVLTGAPLQIARPGIPKINSTVSPELNTTAFDLYKSSGRLELLDEDLGLKIQSLYIMYETWDENMDYFNDLVSNKIRTRIGDFMITEREVQQMKKNKSTNPQMDIKKVRALLNDVELARYLFAHTIASRECKRNYSRGLEKIDEVVAAIDQYLEQ
jgi:hypothetical protein